MCVWERECECAQFLQVYVWDAADAVLLLLRLLWTWLWLCACDVLRSSAVAVMVLSLLLLLFLQLVLLLLLLLLLLLEWMASICALTIGFHLQRTALPLDAFTPTKVQPQRAAVSCYTVGWLLLRCYCSCCCCCCFAPAIHGQGQRDDGAQAASRGAEGCSVAPRRNLQTTSSRSKFSYRLCFVLLHETQKGGDCERGVTARGGWEGRRFKCNNLFDFLFIYVCDNARQITISFENKAQDTGTNTYTNEIMCECMYVCRSQRRHRHRHTHTHTQAQTQNSWWRLLFCSRWLFCT